MKGHQEDLERGKQTKRQDSGGRNKKAEAAEETEGESGSTVGGCVESPALCPFPHFLEGPFPTHDNGCQPSECVFAEFLGPHP